MNDRQLRHFSVLAETLSFRDAAARLNIVQPALSMSIKRLEEEFGAELFERTTREVRLTAAGRAAIAEVNKMLGHLEQAKQNARMAKAGAIGNLAIGFVGSASFALLPAVVRAFRANHPHVVLTLQESSGRRILSLIETGEMDLGLVRIPAVHCPGVTIQPLEQGCFVAVVPADSPWAPTAAREIRLGALADAPFINYSFAESPMLHMAIVNACREAGFAPRIVQEAIQVQTLIALVESGLGVGLVPSISVRHKPRGARFLALKDPTPACETGLALAYHPDNLSEAGAHFVDVVCSAGSGRRR
ncbi:LysR family transcriptional regulator [Bordetella petrii]|nr:LysR family transcriptional regulator [Bordetella petrii]